MRYVMREKIFALGDDFVIKDETGAERFKVDGKVFSIGNKLSFQDPAGNELAFIKQKLLSISSKYEIYREGNLAAVVKKELFTLFRCKFTVDVPGPNDLEAKGDFFDHEYEFMRNGRVVGACSKRWFSLSDTYGIEVAPGEDDVLILASSVVIDMICHEDKNQ